MKLLFVIVIGLLVAGLLGQQPEQPARTIQEAWDQTMGSPRTDADVRSGAIGFAVMIILSIALSIRDKEFRSQIVTILLSILVAILLYGLVTVIIPVMTHQGGQP